jgi:putative SOS response-associated peptidase YedK
MPVMLGVDSARRWLDAAENKELLLDECLTDFKVYKVDRRVNNSRQEDKSLIEPI